jgi:hypothetical protein
MKNIAFLLIAILVSCTTAKYEVAGTYKIHVIDSFGYGKECYQLTLFNDSTYEYVTCGELKFSSYGSWKMTEDTIHFEGSGSILSRPVNHSKFLFIGKSIYKVHQNNEADKIWTFKRKSRKPRPYKNI